MFALLENNIVVAVNGVGFKNAVLREDNKIIEVDFAEIGMLWDGDRLSEDDSINPLNAQSEMIEELKWVDLQFKYHQTDDTKRAVSTVESLKQHAIACRDYVQNIEGVLTIIGDKPERPQ